MSLVDVDVVWSVPTLICPLSIFLKQTEEDVTTLVMLTKYRKLLRLKTPTKSIDWQNSIYSR
jgi:hypothetical protein